MQIIAPEIEQFFKAIVIAVRSKGVPCAITSGMACVAYGVALGTKDCDVLCDPKSADVVMSVLREARIREVAASYRSHLSPPLDARWMRGGWTSHFCWDSDAVKVHLDIFGVAPRASSAWEPEVQDLFAGMHTVAEMKRTDREKDWPFATALGVKLLSAGDTRGWLHVFNHEVLLELTETLTCPAEMIVRRPSLSLAVARDDRLELALDAEMKFWNRLDRLRTRVHQTALRPYVLAVKRDPIADDSDLRVQHDVRVAWAERLLPTDPLRSYGLDRLIAEAREQTTQLTRPEALQWLPDVRANFWGLGS